MNGDSISVISIPDISLREEYEDNRKANSTEQKEKDVSYWNVSYLFAILAFGTFFASSIYI